MNVSFLLISTFCMLIFGMLWMRWKKPRAPYMEYKIRFKWYDFIINVFGSWIFLFGGGIFEEQLVKMPHIETHFVMLVTRIISLLLCGSYMKYTVQRTTHPGSFIIPTTMNIIASISQSEALNIVAVPEFAASKALRLAIVGVFGGKSNKESLLWILISIISSHFMFMYEFSTVSWLLPSHLGIIWLLLFIFTDSFTSISQELIFKKFKVGNVTMMYYINMYIIILMIPQLLLDLSSSMNFFNSFIVEPVYLFYLLCLTVCMLLAQFFTLRLIRQFGALSFVCACIFRSIFTIVIAKYIINQSMDLLEFMEVAMIILLTSFTFVYRMRHKKENKLPPALNKI